VRATGMNRKKYTSALDRLVEARCDRERLNALLANVRATHPVSQNSVQGGRARKAQADLAGLRLAAATVNRLLKSFPGRLVAAEEGNYWYLPSLLESFAKDFELVSPLCHGGLVSKLTPKGPLMLPAKSLPIAMLVGYVVGMTEEFHDAEVSELLACTLAAHSKWRKRHQKLVNYCAIL
jgi:hypothetical protein